ncbi:MAG: 2-(1,2-epoxy,2-dihydrophenyl)acetyl-CoA isomerase [Actinomycetota bacterium]|jgi:enoyl-CoA hydratase/carnithine racemase|nr:2-(1,2-epoxy,2-dihydrophenyl)acetyl-CoA isomerase [Actinomycetota bacterium]
MPEEPAVAREVIGDVVVLRMNRAARHNILDAEMIDALVSATSTLAQEDNAGAMILTGAGSHFSLGGPIEEFAEVLGGGEGAVREYCRERTEALATVIRNLHTMPCPVIAAVHGQAAGAGFSLALACDLRIASDRAKFNFAYGALGSSTDGAMSWLLPRVLSPAKALELLLAQPVIRASRAHTEGLVTEVVPVTELHNRALDIATGLSRNARHSVRAAKRLVHASAFTTLAEHLRAEHRTFADGLLTNDMRHALASRRRGELPTFGGTT